MKVPLMDLRQFREKEIAGVVNARAEKLGLSLYFSSIIRHLMLETAYFTSTIAPYNLGNIKGEGPAGYSEKKDDCGSQNCRFRAYSSWESGVDAYLSLLLGKYRIAETDPSDVREFADALARGGYFTDPDGAKKIVSLPVPDWVDDWQKDIDSEVGYKRRNLAQKMSDATKKAFFVRIFQIVAFFSGLISIYYFITKKRRK